MRLNHEFSVAAIEVEKVLEEMRSLPPREIPARYPADGPVVVESLPGAVLTVEYPHATLDPLHVRIALRWVSPDIGAVERVFETARAE